MRILSISFPLPNVAIDNYNPLTAPSYADYDALIIDPAGIDRAVRDVVEEGKEMEAFDGRPVLNVPGSATVAGIADQLRRRGEETRRLLEAGGLVVVLARPDAMQPGVVGFEGCDRYHWLPAPGGLSWGPPFLRAGEGRTVRIADEHHPFTGLLREYRKEVSWRAWFDDRQAEFRRHGHVVAVGGSGLPIAAEFAVLGGRVVFVPVMAESFGTVRTQLAQAFVDACRQLAGKGFEQEAPYWVRSVAVPGLEQVEAELEEAEAAAAEATSRLTAVRERHDALARYRDVLWRDGAAFREAVGEALRLLGFAVVSEPGEPLAVRSEETTAFVELECATGQVVEWPYIRLQRRIEAEVLAGRPAPNGLVVANGFREQDPDQRKDEFSEALVRACENYRYGLLPGRELFELVKRALGGADEATLLGLRRRMLARAGLLSAETLLSADEQAPETGPIF
ncbi:hypothetical protein [Tepidiforma sp.]|uniref:hypothetical protein n=1 Tax=Tepidiforma sp. TaxID=2682230 RepID=UPI002ADD3FDF|nr:hypothetical protein [Tepidiforma sp.]